MTEAAAPVKLTEPSAMEGFFVSGAQMSLDATRITLTKTGTVTIGPEGIILSGFEGENASCRDVAVLGCMWALGELQRECLKTIERPGGGNTGID